MHQKNSAVSKAIASGVNIATHQNTITLMVQLSLSGIIGKLHSRQTMSFEFDSNPTPFITLATFNPTLGMTLGAADANSRSLVDKINQKSDIVRRLYLGTSPPEPLKRCTR